MGYEDQHFHSDSAGWETAAQTPDQICRYGMIWMAWCHLGLRVSASVLLRNSRVVDVARRQLREIRGRQLTRGASNRCRCQNVFYEVSVSADGVWSGSSLCCCSTCPPSVFMEHTHTHTHTHRTNTLFSRVGRILLSVQVQQFAPSAYINSSALIKYFHLITLYTLLHYISRQISQKARKLQIQFCFESQADTPHSHGDHLSSDVTLRVGSSNVGIM